MARFRDAHPEVREKTSISSIARYWAALEPTAAHQWVAAQDMAADDSSVVSEFVAGIWLNDREAAADYVRSHGDEEGFDEAVQTVACSFYLESPQDAKKFAESLSNQKARREAITGIAHVASFIAEREGESAKDPRNVAEWLVQFPQDDWKGSLAHTIQEWGEARPEEVVHWIVEQPNDRRAAIVAEYKLPLLDEDSRRSVDAVMHLPDNNLREDLIVAYLQHERTTGVIIGSEIAKLPLSQNEKQRISARLGPDKPPRGSGFEDESPE